MMLRAKLSMPPRKLWRRKSAFFDGESAVSSLKNILSRISPQVICALIAGVSLLSLAAAYMAQYGFGLLPCELCLIQRIPFAVNILLGFIGIFWAAGQRGIICTSAVVFLINSGIAFFHSGVERHWWPGLEGCSAPQLGNAVSDILSRLEQTPAVRCDAIPWQFLGLSMANYNVVFCAGLALLLFGYLYITRRTKS